MRRFGQTTRPLVDAEGWRAPVPVDRFSAAGGRMGRAGWGLLLAFWAGVAQGRPITRDALVETIARQQRPVWLKPARRAEASLRWLPPLGRYGLPWEEPVFERVALLEFAEGPWLLSLGTVGALQTGFSESEKLAGARLFTLADVPGLRVGPRESPWALGAGLLVGLNRNFTPGDSWALFTIGRPL